MAQSNNFFDTKVLGHPAGLFVLFFTEMWERFSFYGMRVLLINFLTMALIGYNPGWDWDPETATALFGTYAMLLYITPILGGIIADKAIGYRWAVVIGSIVMTLGHVSMAFETEFSMYLGLALLVIGTGFFKPNMTSIVSEMYKDFPEKKDGAYTIFYMGVNAGAFFGMMLCGYLAERVGWSWGFGLAGVFMLLGTLQFWLAKPLFGTIGEVPSKVHEVELPQNINEDSAPDRSEEKSTDKRNPFTLVDKILTVLALVIGLGYALNDPISKIAHFDMFGFADNMMGTLDGNVVMALIGLVIFLYLVMSRLMRYEKVIRNRMWAFIIFAFFTVFFWMSFEQGATSLVIFARDSVDRVLSGNSAVIFNIVNALLSVIPLAIITYVLVVLAKKTGKRIPGSNIVLIVCFLGVWAVVGWMLVRDFNTKAYDVTIQVYEDVPVMVNNSPKINKETGEVVTRNLPVTIQNQEEYSQYSVKNHQITIGEAFLDLSEGEEVVLLNSDNEMQKFRLADEAKQIWANERALELSEKNNGLVKGTITNVKESWVEITVSWFSILNSFFIIAFANLFSKWWESKYNPSATMKYGLGLIIMALGFGLLAVGSYGIGEGVKVSMLWLILAYLFHTLGELCISPVGLSYVSKLVPARMIAFMFGMWYLAIAIGNKFAAILGGKIETITEEYSLSTFFLIFTIVPAVFGLIIILLKPAMEKLMAGVK